MEACPVHTDSGRYVQLIAEGRFEDAFLVARAPNPLASVCGRVCSAPCEDACRRAWVDEAVTIRPLKRFVTEQFGAESARPDFFKLLMSGPQQESPDTADDAGCRRLWHVDQLSRDDSLDGTRGHRVAVIGSGPAGLGCAHDLAMMGYDVTVPCRSWAACCDTEFLNIDCLGE
jgi:NADPH-dependent glutamate synthase beta subunit-like oxidoreductase